MDGRQQRRWFRWRLAPRSPAEPGAAMFAHVRLRLTLWYSGVLGSALLLFSIGLYLSVQYMLFMPIKNELAATAHRLSLQWQRSPEDDCSPPDFGLRRAPPPRLNASFFFACFDQHGNLLQG